MKITKVPVLGMFSVSAGLLVLAAGSPAFAQNCYATHSAAFARLYSVENQATTQGSSDVQVRALFGPKNELCEEGAYKTFMESFKDFAARAMRAPKTSRDKLLRVAISAISQAPSKVPAKEVKLATNTYRQVRSDLNATADDVGFAQTPLLQQLLDAIAATGAPRAAEEGPATVQVPVSPPTTTTSPTPSGGVQSIRVPQEPLPGWAVVKLYEMRDTIKAQDLAALQVRLQDIINWIEAKAPPANP